MHQQDDTRFWRTATRSRRVRLLGATMVIGAVLASSAIANAAPGPDKTGTSSKAVAETTTTTALVVDRTKPLGERLELDTKGAVGMAAEFSEWNTTRSTTIGEAARAIGSDQLAAAGLTGQGVDIAVIDTGVAPVIGLDGADKVVNGPDLSLDFQARMPVAVDAFGHGTHMASIAANSENGIARGARLVNLKVGAVDGAVDVTQVIAAINWVIEHRNTDGLHIGVLNLAYGTDSVQHYRKDPLAHAVEQAWKHGIVVVVSAGNDAGPVAMPAADPYVLSVGAADTADPANPIDDTLAPFSARGSKDRGVDVLAPGVSILGLRVPGSTVDRAHPDAVVAERYLKGSGTSQAAAVASGAIAQLLQARPTLTPDEVKFLLMITANPLPTATYASQGGGLLDLGQALMTPAPVIVGNWGPSSGDGSIESSRGSYHLVADDGVTTLSGEVDVQGARWDKTWFGPATTAGTTWTGGNWNGNAWSAGDWTTATQLSGIAWDARTWRSSTWSARTWRGDLWAARSWRDAAWDGRTWR